MVEEMGASGVPHQGAPDTSETKNPTAKLPVELWRSILLVQLGECWNDIRNIDGLVWQIPAGIGAILGLILTGLGTRALKGRPSLIDVAAMFAVVLVSYSLIVALHKNRMFQISRNKYMKGIYKQLLATHSASNGALVPIRLDAHDDCPMDELPGFVARATRDIANESQAGSVASWGVLALFSARMRKFSAYNTMFRVSVCVLVGEFLLAVWLFIRFL
jgi:hypothetical protein